MSDSDVWKEKAAMLRDRAGETDEVDRRRVLLTLAEDCDQMAAAKETARSKTVNKRKSA
jgi:hypothetical protein